MNRLPLNEKKFKELVKKSKHFNIFPIYLPDYLPEIKEHPITTLLAELVEEAFQYLSIMSNQEIDSMLESLPPAIMMMVDHCPHCRAGERLKRIAIYYVVAEVQLSYFAFKQVIDGCIDNSEVLKIYPELKENFDKDGLLYINDNFILHDGGIEYRNHILHYHQLLRREYKSQPNYDFIANFLKYYYQSNSKNQFRLAIDHYRIMPKEFYSQILEFDTWFGPSFDRRKLEMIQMQ